MEEDTFYKMADKEYFKIADVHPDDAYNVKPDYPTSGGYMLVDHRSMEQMGGEKPCFHSMDDAVMWAKNNLNHNDFNVYKLDCVL